MSSFVGTVWARLIVTMLQPQKPSVVPSSDIVLVLGLVLALTLASASASVSATGWTSISI